MNCNCRLALVYVVYLRSVNTRFRYSCLVCMKEKASLLEQNFILMLKNYKKNSLSNKIFLYFYVLFFTEECIKFLSSYMNRYLINVKNERERETEKINFVGIM